MQRAITFFTQDHFLKRHGCMYLSRQVQLTNTSSTDDIKRIARFALTTVIAWGIYTNMSFSTRLIRG